MRALNKTEHVISFIFAGVLLLLQAWLVRFYPLWVDETFSIARAVDHPVREYLRGNSLEGNTAPLYFLFLKFFYGLDAYLPLSSRVTYRLISIVPTAVAATLVLRWALSVSRAGAFSLVLALAYAILFFVHPTALSYFWQCRPYAPWILLSTIQTIWLLDEALYERRRSIVAHFFLNLFLVATVPVAVFQVAAGASLLLYFRGWRLVFNRGYICAVGVPFALTLFWKLASRETFLYMWPGWFTARALVFSHLQPKLFLVPLLLPMIYLRGRFPWRGLMPFILYCGIGIALLVLFYLAYSSAGPGAFELPNRYFIFLFPVLILTWIVAWNEVMFPKTIVGLIFLILISYIFFKGQKHAFFPKAPRETALVASIRSVAESTDERCFCFRRESGTTNDPHFWMEAILFSRKNRAGEECADGYKPVYIQQAQLTNGQTEIRMHSIGETRAARIDEFSSCE